MQMTTTAKNWDIGTTPAVLDNIHDDDINIAIYERDIQALTTEINALLEADVTLRASGDADKIMKMLTSAIDSDTYQLVLQDIDQLLRHFSAITRAASFRLLLTTVATDMCRKFHTDVNDLRMLCTYSGPGTLWLSSDNINLKALHTSKKHEEIAIDQQKIQQAKTGAAIILKGAIYPRENVQAVVHRSPTIEESGDKRLLLRIDTNEFLNF